MGCRAEQKAGLQAVLLASPWSPFDKAMHDGIGHSAEADADEVEAAAVPLEAAKRPSARARTVETEDCDGATVPLDLAARPPSQIYVHLALFIGQAINGGSSVVAKVGLPHINPVFFALCREVSACPFLFAVACCAHGRPRLAVKDLPLLAFAAFSLFSNQLAWTTGLKLANPVVGSAWQPSQPVFVLAMAVLLRWEKCTVLKTLGVLCALAGGAVMTFNAHGEAAATSSSPLVGNSLFLYNCSMTAVFILCMRVLTRQMPAYTALAIVYLAASIGILAVSLVVGESDSLQAFFCPDCEDSFWSFPIGAMFALAYWVLGCSVAAYLLLTFGTKHAADATHCLAYTAMQPVVAGALEAIMVAAGWNNEFPERPLRLVNGMQVFGACIVVFGVACVACEARAMPSRAAHSSTSVGAGNEDGPAMAIDPREGECQPMTDPAASS